MSGPIGGLNYKMHLFYRSGKYQSSVLNLLPEKVSLKTVKFRGF